MPPTTRVSDVVVNATYVINVPIMKFHAYGSGVSLGLKNHWGTIDGPQPLHNYMWVGGPYLRPDYSALIDVYKNPNLGPKTVLVMADALLSWRDGFDEVPVMWDTFGNKPPNSLLFAADPVAIDSVMCDIIEIERDGLKAKTNLYLSLVARPRASARSLRLLEFRCDGTVRVPARYFLQLCRNNGQAGSLRFSW